MRKPFLKGINSLVVKVGTSVLTKDGKFDPPMIRRLAAEISVCLEKGLRVSIVSSGAIGSGMTLLGMKKRPKTMEGLQAAAAVGQRYLMQCYEEAFSARGFSTAQVLLTWEDLAHSSRFLNAKRTLRKIQKWGLVPVINENDTVATDEIRFGDNDRLSALLSVLVEADLLVILSDTDGLYQDGRRGHPRYRLRHVPRMDRSVFSHVKDRKNAMTVGGMRSKLKAIDIGVSSGIPVVLADGRMPRVLSRIFRGEDVGTLFLPEKPPGAAHGNWTAHFVRHINKGR
ncbi:MAG: glutamate 5-kinase [Candidatus Omnitrophica bacterium]|nr:glutamate 5-kinase [Candidatus Omnitrophota bacterium]